MSNIINFSDKRKVNDDSPKNELLKVLEKMRTMVEEDKIVGFAGIAVGEENKIVTIMGGEFDIINMAGGLDALKMYLYNTSSMEFTD